MSFQILDHGARRKRAELRRIIGEHFVTEQIAKAEQAAKRKLSPEEKRGIAENRRERLEKRGFYKDH